MLESQQRAVTSFPSPDLFAGGGEMGRRIRETDWSATPLGAAAEWPAPLRVALRIVLASHEPLGLWWGADCTFFYNDACKALLGADEPNALGRPAPSAWLGGPAQISAVIDRDGMPLEAHYTLALSPVPGERGGLGGVLCMFSDVTGAVLLERRIHLLERATNASASAAELAATKEELALQVERLTRLHALALRLGGMTEIGPMLQAILDTAVDAQGGDFGLVWLHDPASNALVIEASRNFDARALQQFDRVVPGPAGGSAGNAFAQHRRWIVEDVYSDPAFEAFRGGARAAGFRSVHSTPIVTRSGALLGVISVHFAARYRPSQRDMQVADVCARHAADAIEAFRSQQRLRESERLYRAIGESIDYGVWVCDAEGRNTYASESFLKLIGMTQEQCSGDGWGEVLHPDDREGTFSAWRECVRTGGKWDIEHRVRGVDGKWHSVLARGVPVRNDRGDVVGWAGINLEIDRLKQVEEELRELDQRKDEFLATLAHELRNPLAPIRNGLEVMRLAAANPPTVEKARGMMERQLAQMVRLVDDLLDVSRVSRGKIELRREEVELAAVLRSAMETSQPLMANRHHELVAEIPEDPIVIDGDLTRLAQVFGNLLTNAAKYTEPGGRIELAVIRHADEVEVAIRDNGIGIPPGMQARVFDVFTQVDRSLEKAQGGLGIGLSIAKRLVEMHGGAIWVNSKGHGQGSEFVVRLPVKGRTRQRAFEAPRPQAGVGGPRHRIIVADDNPDTAETLSIMLGVMGHEVRVAHCAQEAIALAAESLPDVILLDIGMPGMNGYEACQKIRAQAGGRDAFIVALTGWGQEEDRARAKAAGFDRHLIKPVEPLALESLIGGLPPRQNGASAA